MTAYSTTVILDPRTYYLWTLVFRLVFHFDAHSLPPVDNDRRRHDPARERRPRPSPRHRPAPARRWTALDPQQRHSPVPIPPPRRSLASGIQYGGAHAIKTHTRPLGPQVPTSQTRNCPNTSKRSHPPQPSPPPHHTKNTSWPYPRAVHAKRYPLISSFVSLAR